MISDMIESNIEWHGAYNIGMYHLNAVWIGKFKGAFIYWRLHAVNSDPLYRSQNT